MNTRFSTEDAQNLLGIAVLAPVPEIVESALKVAGTSGARHLLRRRFITLGGELERERLQQEIVSRDVLYLFWSRAASKSQWVEIEWRTALASKGLEHIDPVPLEPGDVTPPPPELTTLHFNDWTLAFEK